MDWSCGTCDAVRPLLDGPDGAFSQSFETVAIVSAVLLTLAAVTVGLRLRNVILTAVNPEL